MNPLTAPLPGQSCSLVLMLPEGVLHVLVVRAYFFSIKHCHNPCYSSPAGSIGFTRCTFFVLGRIAWACRPC